MPSILGRALALGVAGLILLIAGCAPEPTIPAQPSAATSIGPVSAETSVSSSASPTAEASTTEPVAPSAEQTPETSPSVEPSAEPASEKPVSAPTTPMAGPAILQEGGSGESVRDLQARLQQINWFLSPVTGNYGPQTAQAVRGFQAKRGIAQSGYVDQITLDKLYAMTRKPTADELAGRKPTSAQGMTLDSRCLTGRVLCASKAQKKLAWVIDGQIQVVLDARFGRASLPTRNGEFTVGWKSRDHWSTLYKVPMPYAMFFDGGQAVHYSSDFAANGYNGASHGCINIRDKAAISSLFDVVQVGDRVVVYPG